MRPNDYGPVITLPQWCNYTFFLLLKRHIRRVQSLDKNTVGTPQCRRVRYSLPARNRVTFDAFKLLDDGITYLSGT